MAVENDNSRGNRNNAVPISYTRQFSILNCLNFSSEKSEKILRSAHLDREYFRLFSVANCGWEKWKTPEEIEIMQYKVTLVSFPFSTVSNLNRKIREICKMRRRIRNFLHFFQDFLKQRRLKFSLERFFYKFYIRASSDYHSDNHVFLCEYANLPL